MDVRAADSIRISYDHERDGWKIEQASTFEWEANDTVCDPDWQEVAFVQAWGRERE
jgi:gentisate 1,2-dioxygenase